MFKFIKKQSPTRIMAAGFLLLILIGSLLLTLPISLKDGVSISYINSLHTTTSAVCVTGLVTVDVANTFSIFGQIVIILLIQVGGLGVTTFGAMLVIAVSGKMGLKGITVMRESLNLDSAKGIKNFILDIFLTTLLFEFIGAIILFFVFSRDYAPAHALWISVFHSISAFNNAGFDIIGNFVNMIPYQSDVLLNLTTSALIIFGGMGFLVIKEIFAKKHHVKKYSMHAKVVLTMTIVLLALGTVMIKLTENVTWMGAFFLSTSARTAGFTTYDLSRFTRAGLLTISALIFIGASPGSTGGGIKTTTFFVLLVGIKSAATNRAEKAFKYSMPSDSFKKSAVIFLLGLFIVCISTFAMCLLEPIIPLEDIFFEVVNAFGTAGLSTGITPNLTWGSKFISVICMYIGRLGPLTIATLWSFSKGENYNYPVGNIAVG